MSEWWEEFFTGEWLSVHGRMFGPQESAFEAEGICNILDLWAGAEILDVPCGEGRHAVALAELGLGVTGVDLSEGLLQQAAAKAEAAGVSVELVRKDVRDIDWVERFDAAACMWNSIGYFDEEGDEAFLRAVARSLRPGGRLVIDTQCAETLLPRWSNSTWQDLGDVLVLQRRIYDHRTARNITEWRFVRGEEVHVGRTSIRVYTCHELIALAKRAGFSRVDLFSSLTGRLFTMASSQLYLVAHR